MAQRLRVWHIGGADDAVRCGRRDRYSRGFAATRSSASRAAVRASPSSARPAKAPPSGSRSAGRFWKRSRRSGLDGRQADRSASPRRLSPMRSPTRASPGNSAVPSLLVTPPYLLQGRESTSGRSRLVPRVVSRLCPRRPGHHPLQYSPGDRRAGRGRDRRRADGGVPRVASVGVKDSSGDWANAERCCSPSPNWRS